MIYFKSNRSGSDQIWKVPAVGGTATQPTRRGASEAFVAPDGKVVYCTKHPWGQIWDGAGVALSNDGRLLLVACVDQEVNDLMLIENFH